uniref:Uncharacterized protein n=1 Tax=Trichogramma kaykai TaxID=54128 RepID=A0ABD2WEQ7_9HYME
MLRTHARAERALGMSGSSRGTKYAVVAAAAVGEEGGGEDDKQQLALSNGTRSIIYFQNDPCAPGEPREYLYISIAMVTSSFSYIDQHPFRVLHTDIQGAKKGFDARALQDAPDRQNRESYMQSGISTFFRTEQLLHFHVLYIAGIQLITRRGQFFTLSMLYYHHHHHHHHHYHRHRHHYQRLYRHHRRFRDVYVHLSISRYLIG